MQSANSKNAAKSKSSLLPLVASAGVASFIVGSLVRRYWCQLGQSKSESVVTLMGSCHLHRPKTPEALESAKQTEASSQWQLICEASAPGKVILCGEHAVVYGHSALAAAIGKRTAVRVYRSAHCESKECVIIAESGGVSVQWPATALWSLTADSVAENIAAAAKLGRTEARAAVHWEVADFRAVFATCFATCFAQCAFGRAVNGRSLRFAVASQMPIGCGLGASAALSTALCAAMRALAALPFDREAICEAALAAECVAHGSNASGVDNTVAAFGGFVSFARSRKPAIRRVAPTRSVRILVAETGVRSSTKAMVDAVAGFRRTQPQAADALLSALGALSQAIEGFFQNNALPFAHLQTLFCAAHFTLCALGVGHWRMSQLAALFPAKGLKLTGAGGGGCVLLPIASDSQKASALCIFADAGYHNVFEAQLGQSGVCVQCTLPKAEQSAATSSKRELK